MRTRQDGSSLRNVVVLGFVSFFADLSTEMVYPLIPLFLTGAFGATPALVGVIEGIAESTASLLRVFSGYIADKYQRKKPLAFIGYATGLVYKLALILATSWTGVLAARVLDRIGKGIRTAPRDVMVAESGSADQLGMAYGLRETLDMAGSALGILVAYLLVTYMGGSLDLEGYRHVFAISVIPVIVALCLFPLLREKRAHVEAAPRERFWEKARSLDHDLRLYLVVATLFTLGNSSNAFLLLRAGDMGFDAGGTILLYLAYNASCSVLSIPLGKLSDRVGRKHVLVAGYVIFAAVYFVFAFPVAPGVLVTAFIAYGAYQAVIMGAERAFIAEIAPPELKGTMLGLESTLVGVALMPASAIAGALWVAFGGWAPFTLGATLALAAAAVLAFGLRGEKTVNGPSGSSSSPHR